MLMCFTSIDQEATPEAEADTATAEAPTWAWGG
jgi:hypothetical protein